MYVRVSVRPEQSLRAFSRLVRSDENMVSEPSLSLNLDGLDQDCFDIGREAKAKLALHKTGPMQKVTGYHQNLLTVVLN